ncbi:hypothetical protein [Algoriphagus taiwanensis]|uniref:hypothetical protein n=1 Tax=Algoriphagus taiwanensis TaxID=1445656 RepID=UPI0030C692C8
MVYAIKVEEIMEKKIPTTGYFTFFKKISVDFQSFKSAKSKDDSILPELLFKSSQLAYICITLAEGQWERELGEWLKPAVC